jgi:hypothetical protein
MDPFSGPIGVEGEERELRRLLPINLPGKFSLLKTRKKNIKILPGMILSLSEKRISLAATLPQKANPLNLSCKFRIGYNLVKQKRAAIFHSLPFFVPGKSQEVNLYSIPKF